MSKLYFFVFLSVFFIISNSLSLFKTEKSLSGSGAKKKKLCAKPKMIYPVNETLASKNFFLGTGVEFRFRVFGKYPDINLVFPERWCYDKSKSSLRNNENGLYLEKVSISSGGAGPVILVDRTTNGKPGVFWTFKKISGDIYNILFSGWLRNVPINTYAMTAFMDEQEKTSVSIAPLDPNNVNQQWRVVN